jgi:hypothetical protein
MHSNGTPVPDADSTGHPAGGTSTPDEMTTAAATGGMSIGRIALLASGGFLAVVLLPFLAGILLAAADVGRAGEIIRLIRDLFIIMLSMASILIVIALTVLIVQVASLVNLLQTEIKPLLENMQKTMTTVSGTARFVGANVAGPLIKAGGFMAGLGVFARELGGIRRALRQDEVNGRESGRRAEADER